MNFLQRLTSKSAAPTDAYGSVSTLEENDTSSPHADSLQDADNFKFDTNTTAAVIIKDKLKDSPFLSDLSAGAPPSSPSKIKSSSSTGNVFSSWSAAGNALATIVKKDTASTSNDAEPEAEGKLMEEININWNYVSPAEPRASNDKDVVSGEERLKQTRKVLEEEVGLQRIRLALFVLFAFPSLCCLSVCLSTCLPCQCPRVASCNTT